MEPLNEPGDDYTKLRGRLNFNTGFGVLFFVFSIILLVIIPDQIEKPFFVLSENKDELNPAFFPQLVASAFLVLGIWLFIKSFSIREINKVRDLDKGAIFNVLLTLLVMAAYGPLMMQLGFVVSSALVVAFLCTYFGNRNFILTAVVSTTIPIAIYFIFTKLLATYLPPFPIDTVLTRFYIL